MNVPLYLPLDLAETIAEHLLSGDAVDYISFRAVCKGWRLRTASPNSLASCFRPRHWFMLTDGDANFHTGNNRRFFNLHSCQCRVLSLPELDSHSVFAACDGLLILIDNSTRIVRIFNPFTRYLSDLPPLPTVDNITVDIAMMIHLCNVSISDGDCPTAVIYSPFLQAAYFAKPGDLSWQSVYLCGCPNSVLFFNDHWYLTDWKHGLRKIDPDLKSVKPLTLNFPAATEHDKCYLVNCNSEMFLLHRKSSRDGKRIKPADQTLDIFRVDLETNQLVPINNIGDLALLVGFRGRILVLSSKDLPSIERNSIYLCTGEPTNPIVVYNLDDREIKPISVGTSVHDCEKRIASSIRPFTLVHHLAAYGSPLRWAAGLMCHEFMVFPKGWFVPGCEVYDIQKKYMLFVMGSDQTTSMEKERKEEKTRKRVSDEATLMDKERKEERRRKRKKP